MNRLYFFLLLLAYVGVFDHPDVLGQQLFTPRSMQGSVVKVVTISGSDTTGLGAGLKYRTDQDSIYVLSAFHLFDDQFESPSEKQISIEFYNGSTHIFSLGEYTLTRFENIDLVSIKVVTHDSLGGSDFIRTHRSIEDYPAEYSDVYALGCARSNCWHRPIEAKLTELQHEYLEFTSPFLLPGLSGGILVDNHGYVLGIISSSRAGIGRAIPLFALTAYDFPDSNLANSLLESNPKYYDLSFYLSLLPFPPHDVSGRIMAPGFRFVYRPFDLNVSILNPIRLSVVAGRSIYSVSTSYSNDPVSNVSSTMYADYLGVKASQALPVATINNRVLNLGISVSQVIHIKNYRLDTKGHEVSIASISDPFVVDTPHYLSTLGNIRKYGMSLEYPLSDKIRINVSLKITMVGASEEIEIDNDTIDVSYAQFPQFSFGISCCKL